MRLPEARLHDFAEAGWLFLPGCFTPEQIAVLRSEAEAIYATDREEVWRETNGAPRSPPTPTTRASAFSAATRA